MTIDWSKAPEGATHYDSFNTRFYKQTGNVWCYHDDDTDSWYESTNVNQGTRSPTDFTPRPSEPKPYTRDEALQFLVERLDSWPTDIADAPLCPGWGWELWTYFEHRAVLVSRDYGGAVFVAYTDWCASRPDFVPFVSVEDAQPATAKQPAPSGKGDPILGMVLADLTNRALEGREKYGEALKANNGRNALWDAYQEALDLTMYLRQAIEEQSK